MQTISDLVPDVDVLLRLPPEALARILLRLAKAHAERGRFQPNDLLAIGTAVAHYPADRMTEVETLLSKAWQWLRLNFLILAAPGTDGQFGWIVLSPLGADLAKASDQEFARFRDAAASPRSLLHASIPEKVWLALARGDLDEAVFAAFKAVEEAVRLAGNFGPSHGGVDLMRKAFGTDGPLANKLHPEAEREALADLFAGAMASWQNPLPDRAVSITDPQEAQALVAFASHLLRVVVALKPLPPAAMCERCA